MTSSRDTHHKSQDLSSSQHRAARAVAAACAVAKKHGIRADEPRILANAYAVRVHLHPAPVVARVSTLTAILRQPITAWLSRELDICQFLAARGAPVVAPSELLPPGPHLHDGLAISFWRYVAPLPNAALPGADICGPMLAELHAAMRDYDGELPYLAPPLQDIANGLQRLTDLDTVMAKEDVAMLRYHYNELRAQLLVSSGPYQALHGDAHAMNLLPSVKGFLWNDFEDVCLGPIAWDLSCMHQSLPEVLATYPGAPDPATLALYQKVRLLHGTVWGHALLVETPEWQENVRALLGLVRQQLG